MPVRYLPASKPAQVTYVKTVNKSELKTVDYDINLTAGNVPSTTNTNAAMLLVNAVQPGTGSWNRIGKKIRMKSLRLKYLAVGTCNPTAAGISNNTLRMAVVYDKQPSNGPIPNFDTVFGSTSQTGAEATLSIFDSLRIDNTERFHVLKEEIVTTDLQTVQNPNASEWQQYIDCFINLRGLETVYSGQSNPCTIADISSGALYVIFRAESNVIDVGRFVIKDSSARLRYYD